MFHVAEFFQNALHNVRALRRSISQLYNRVIST